jgi:putative membrane protein
MLLKSIALSVLMTGLSGLPASAAPGAVGPPAAEPVQDATFLRAAHQADLAEIAGGNIAQERGVSPRVRALGARFVRDHTAIETHLTAVARAAGVQLPDTPTAAQLALVKKYQSVPRAAFDRLYLRTQLKAHEEALAAGRTELAKGEDQRVKDLIAYAAPLVMAHHAALRYGGPAR